ncbi:MAG: PilN domain-containing protein [Deltaproteobacteria bacterium]|nr:PilN domain-containing protein [Deltaproteobacteria bacterium]
MIRINLLPVRAARKKEEVQRQLILFTIFLVGVLLVGIGILQANRSNLANVQQSNRQLEAEIADLKKIIGEVDEYKKQKALLEKKLEVIRKLKADKTGPVHMLDELALRIPEKLWLESIDEANNKVTLKGVSINNEVIATFMNKLEDSTYFAEVFLVSIQAREEGDLKLKEFTITSQLTVPGTGPGGT